MSKDIRIYRANASASATEERSASGFYLPPKASLKGRTFVSDEQPLNPDVIRISEHMPQAVVLDESVNNRFITVAECDVLITLYAYFSTILDGILWVNVNVPTADEPSAVSLSVRHEWADHNFAGEWWMTQSAATTYHFPPGTQIGAPVALFVSEANSDPLQVIWELSVVLLELTHPIDLGSA